MVEALRQKITQMKTAHDNREADWHELSLKWKEFEEQAVVENSRWVVCAFYRVGEIRTSLLDAWHVFVMAVAVVVLMSACTAHG